MASREALAKAMRKGRAISPEIIQQVFDAIAGFGAIKSVAGVKGLRLRLGGKQIAKPETFRSKVGLPEKVRKTRQDIEHFTRTSETSKLAGVPTLRKNIGGKRPPNKELEALALRKQQAQRIAKEDKAMRKEGIKKRTEMFEKEGAGSQGAEKILRDQRRKRTNDILDLLLELLDKPKG